MAKPKLLYLFSPAAPMGSQLFSLGSGVDGAYNPGASASLNDFDAYQFTSLNIASGITITRDMQAVPARDGRGPLVILCQGEATIAGTIGLKAKGCGGASGLTGYAGQGPGGGGSMGAPVAGYPCGGGGGGYATAGGNGSGTAGTPGTGGPAYGDIDLSIVFMGSGGGNGYNGSAALGGGKGGGALILVARKINVTGIIRCNGEDFSYGGSGSGGSILLAALEMSIGTNLATALGGSASSYAGAGSVGRIRLDYKSKSGSTNPAAHEHSGVTLGYLKQFAASAGLGA
jgi:hypothetical protein